MSAPTGDGKCLTFELAPRYDFDRLLGEHCNTIVFVIVPLISLMEDIVFSLVICRRQLFKAAVGGHLNFKNKLLSASPEAILNNY